MILAGTVLSFLGIGRGNLGLVLLTTSVAAFVAIVNSLAYPTIIFAGPTAASLPIGIGLAFVSAAALGAIMALGGSYKGTVAYTQTQPLVILGLIVGPMAAALHARGADDQILPTILAAVAVASLVCGAFLLTLGSFRLGNLIRYIPFPVMGGFLAGIGWLLLVSGIASLAGFELRYDNVRDLAAPGVLEKWLPAVLIGVALRYAQVQRPHVANLPVALLTTAAAFWIGAWLLGASPAQLHESNWLLAEMPAGGLWHPLQTVEDLRSVAWDLFPSYIAQFATLAVISSIALLLNANAIEIATRRDLDLDHDLKYAGFGNLLCGLGAGLPGYHALNASVLSYRMNAPVRFVGLATALVALAAIFGGSHVLSYVPRVVSGALVTDIALGYLLEWLYRSWQRMGRADFAVLFLVFLTVVFVGLMEAIALGTVAGAVLFVLRYSKIRVARNILSGSSYRSTVDRAEPQLRVLRELGDEIFILRLQGFIFFGTANALVSEVRHRLANVRPPLRYLVFDFHLVTGMDASAVAGFTKLTQYASDHKFAVVVCEPSDAITALLVRQRIDPERNRNVRFFTDLDHGLEWAESDLLMSSDPAAQAAAASFEALLAQLYPEPADAERFRRYCDSASYDTGAALTRQGATADDILFIESGRVAIMLELPNGHSVRLRSMGPGLVVGEVAFYLGVPRSASVIAVEPTSTRRLSGERLRAMQRDDPRLATVFHEHMARTLSMKLVETNRLVGALNQ